MPAIEVSMHKIKDVLRLHFEVKLSQHQIAASLQLSSGAVNKYLALSKAANIGWPPPEDLDEMALRALLRPHTKKVGRHNEPDYASIHQELKRKGMTLLLLWQEYEQIHKKSAYRYAQYCAKYREWVTLQKPSMRQVHRAGEKLFIDYCGPTVDVIDPATGEIRSAAIFVAILGASNYTYVEATWDQKLANWIASHVRTFEFLGGVPLLLVPDNLRSAVTKVCRYEPKINETYADLAAHYGAAVLPARPYKPKDKAKVENAVLICERWILARLRHQTFVGLPELNAAIATLLHDLNQRHFKKLPGTRASQFEAIDKPALKKLPAHPYEFAIFCEARVHIDYHIEVDHHYYSVPHKLIKQLVRVRLTATIIECFYNGDRVSSHSRSYQKGKHSTIKEHMPVAHQKIAEWSPERFLTWALDVGPHTRDVIQGLFTKAIHPEQAYRSSFGILNCAKQYGKERLESACQRSLIIGSPQRHSIVSILKNGLDKQPIGEPPLPQKIVHDNIRGAAHYQHQLSLSK